MRLSTWTAGQAHESDELSVWPAGTTALCCCAQPSAMRVRYAGAIRRVAGVPAASGRGEADDDAETRTLCPYRGVPMSSGTIIAPNATMSRTWFYRARHVAFDLVVATAVIWALPLLLAAMIALVKLLRALS